MSTPPQEPRDLNSWKEIAAFLGVSVRTAQKWEEERGLPVRRLPGARGPVSADPASVTAWKNSLFDGPQPASPSVLTKRALLTVALLVAGLAVVAGTYMQMHRKGAPTLFRLESNALIVSDAQGRELWRKVFEAPLDLETYTQPILHYSPAQAVKFGDIDADGHVETLFCRRPWTLTPEGTVLFCFAEDGSEKWRFVPGRTVRTPVETFTAPYVINDFVVLPAGRDGSQSIVVDSCHLEYYPNQVALLSPKGKILREYWHSGCLARLALGDLNKDGRPEIYLGGPSNAYRQATLVVLDPDNFGGASVETAAPNYQIQGFAPGNEMARILFPRTCLNRKFELFNGIFELRLRPDSITAIVLERPRATVLYQLDQHLQLVHAEPEFHFRSLHAETAAAGQIDHTLSPAEEAELRNIRFLPAAASGGRRPVALTAARSSLK